MLTERAAQPGCLPRRCRSQCRPLPFRRLARRPTLIARSALNPLPAQLAIVLLALASVACLFSWLDSSLALLVGIALGLSLGNPLLRESQLGAGWVLKLAVVGLGFGLPLDVVLATARDSLLLTIASIGLALLAGWALARWLKVEPVLGQLLSAGTAICGRTH